MLSHEKCAQLNEGEIVLWFDRKGTAVPELLEVKRSDLGCIAWNTVDQKMYVYTAERGWVGCNHLWPWEESSFVICEAIDVHHERTKAAKVALVRIEDARDRIQVFKTALRYKREGALK